MNNIYYIFSICLIVVLYLIYKNHKDESKIETFVSTPIFGVIGGVGLFVIVLIGWIIAKRNSESKKNTNLKKFKNGYFGSRKVHPDAKQVKPHTLNNNEWNWAYSKGTKDPKNTDNYKEY